MTKLTTSVLAGILLLWGVANAAEPANESGEISDAKAAEIKKLIRLSGMEKLTTQIVSQMISSLRAQETGVPDEFWKRFEQRVDTKELIALVIPLYDKYYTTEDLKAVNAFYESPAGQKVLSTMPQLMQESMKIGQDWGKKLGARIVQELEAEKTKKKKPSEL